MTEDRPRFMERVQKAAAPADARQSRSNAMVVLGLVLFVMAAAIMSTNPDEGAVGAILFGVFGAGLVVGGLVIRR